MLNFLSLFFKVFLQRYILCKNNNLFFFIPSANMKNITSRWWDIYAYPRFFLTKKFLFWKKYDFFFIFYLVPNLINSLNSCVMRKKITIKTFEPSNKNSKFVPPLHLCHFKNGTSYYTTPSHLKVKTFYVIIHFYVLILHNHTSLDIFINNFSQAKSFCGKKWHY